MSPLFVVLILAFLFTQGASAEKDDEEQVFDLWMKEMIQGFDESYQELLKNMETNNPDESGSRAMMSQNTVDRFQELVASMRKDTTTEFWKFMRGMQTEMEGAFEGFMSTAEKEMDANFDDFMTNMMGTGDTRLASDALDSEFQQWKARQIDQAYSKFFSYSIQKNREERANHIQSFLYSEVHNQPRVKRDKEPPLENQIVDAAISVPASALSSEGQGKAGQNPSPSGIPNPQAIANVVPAPIKDRVPGVMSAVQNSAETPTLFIGGFSILMMPMPNGLGNMQQLMQGAPNMMNFMPPTG